MRRYAAVLFLPLQVPDDMDPEQVADVIVRDLLHVLPEIVLDDIVEWEDSDQWITIFMR